MSARTSLVYRKSEYEEKALELLQECGEEFDLAQVRDAIFPCLLRCVTKCTRKGYCKRLSLDIGWNGNDSKYSFPLRKLKRPYPPQHQYQVLQVVPSEWPLNKLAEFLKRAIRDNASRHRDTKVRRGLMQANHLQVR